MEKKPHILTRKHPVTLPGGLSGGKAIGARGIFKYIPLKRLKGIISPLDRGGTDGVSPMHHHCKSAKSVPGVYRGIGAEKWKGIATDMQRGREPQI